MPRQLQLRSGLRKTGWSHQVNAEVSSKRKISSSQRWPTKDMHTGQGVLPDLFFIQTSHWIEHEIFNATHGSPFSLYWFRSVTKKMNFTNFYRFRFEKLTLYSFIYIFTYRSKYSLAQEVVVLKEICLPNRLCETGNAFGILCIWLMQHQILF